METLEKRTNIDLEVVDPETGDVVDTNEVAAWGNPGYELRIYVDHKRVHTHRM